MSGSTRAVSEAAGDGKICEICWDCEHFTMCRHCCEQAQGWLTSEKVAIHLAECVVLLNLANEQRADGAKVTHVLEGQRHAVLEEHVVAT